MHLTVFLWVACDVEEPDNSLGFSIAMIIQLGILLTGWFLKEWSPLLLHFLLIGWRIIWSW